MVLETEKDGRRAGITGGAAAGSADDDDDGDSGVDAAGLEGPGVDERESGIARVVAEAAATAAVAAAA